MSSQMEYTQSTSLIPYAVNFKQTDSEMSLSEHLEELRQRAFWSIASLVLSVTGCLISVKTIVKVLQEPAVGIKFLQFAPGEYFFASLKVATYSGVLISSPFIIYQILLFILPGMTKNERKTILPITLSSLILFIFGLLFGYSLIAPAALNFFINYGSEVVEPFWSFEQYFEFIIVLLFSTAIAFQLPIVQVMLGLLKVVSGSTMVTVWRYVILGSTIVGAILTPSVDPLTQIIMSSIVLVLYFGGAGIVLLIDKSREKINYESKI
jgi:sec-independent protein translocase protein TatC